MFFLCISGASGLQFEREKRMILCMVRIEPAGQKMTRSDNGKEG